VRRAGFLFEQVTDFGALRAAARRAAMRGIWRSRGAATFLAELEGNVLALRGRLVDGTWRPGPATRFAIRDPKPRLITAAPFADRVVHHALCAALEPVLERYAVSDSFACRPGKGSVAALRRVQTLARRHDWFARLDVARFFPSIDHEVLLRALERRIKDRRALALVRAILGTDGVGLPIGSLTSQHFANFYLGALDHHALEVLRVGGWVRYMDDLALFGRSRAEVASQAAAVEAFLQDALRLRPNPRARRLAPVSTGVPVLGFRVWRRQVRLDGARVRRWRARVRSLVRALHGGRLGVADAARRIRSVFAWAELADTGPLRRSFLARLAADGLDPHDAAG
jgi:RNA-directed DNA polymerase